MVATPYAARRDGDESVDAREREGYRQGFEEGCAQGRREAIEESARAQLHDTARAQSALEALATAVRAANEADQRMRAEIQAAAPRLAFALVEELLGREVALAADPGREALTRVLTFDQGSEPAVVRMNPTDLEILGELDPSLSRRDITLVPDASVERGGAVADFGRGSVDAQLSTALSRVREILMGDETGVGA